MENGSGICSCGRLGKHRFKCESFPFCTQKSAATWSFFKKYCRVWVRGEKLVSFEALCKVGECLKGIITPRCQVEKEHSHLVAETKLQLDKSLETDWGMDYEKRCIDQNWGSTTLWGLPKLLSGRSFPLPEYLFASIYALYMYNCKWSKYHLSPLHRQDGNGAEPCYLKPSLSSLSHAKTWLQYEGVTKLGM